MDFAQARKAMVDSQLHTSGIFDRRLLTAMGTVPREAFLPAERRAVAYIDDHHRLNESGRFLPDPSTFGRLVQLAEISAGDSVLVVGSGTGYSLCVIARLAASVTGLESDPALNAMARQACAGITGIEIVEGEMPALAARQFDVIVVEGALESVPADLAALLRPDGRLVALVRDKGVGIARLMRRVQGGVETTSHFNATLPVLFKGAGEPAFIF
ncbi:MAG: methyltransferase domain-containing protein [Devosia sp.]|uniref:protein-L-isoaspartate O-methyltransferase family protein n=1 Tax=Devosia sp. TaxID=1871048 RepID=UPI0024CBEC55|nr:methyltransferase domain-containing protein [Devosia sp.]UYO00060.1 MAG: methyltransferase domain-containing protein [Devosia sp.]